MSVSTGLNIPAQVLRSAKVTAEDVLIDFAVYLYDRERLSIGQAKNLAQMDIIFFQKELAKRDVYIKYDIEDYEEDLKSLDVLRNDENSKKG